MGEVYRARDTRLNRDVAIKVLPAALARDSDRLARLEQEARAAASLNAPGIVAVHDIGSYSPSSSAAEVSLYIVMELLEGESLRARIEQGPVPPRKAADYAAQVATALAAAHARGIVHRDLKPENLFLTRDGRVKVLDFGLAKEITGAPAGTSLTTGIARTAAGTVLGTVGYMAPEQVRGEAADARSDIFALGATLYEMLTGKRAFARATAVETMNAILNEEPADLAPEMTASVPGALQAILSRCLEKRPEDRFHSAHDLALALQASASGRATSSSVERVVSPRASWHTPTIAAAAVAVVALGVSVPLLIKEPPARPHVEALRQLTDLPGAESHADISPDGRQVLYTSRASGNADVYLLRVGGGRAINLTAGSGAEDEQGTFSPDGERIAFRSSRDGGGLFVMGATGESVRRVTASGFDPAWSPDGKMLAFANEPVIDPYSRVTSSQIWTVDLESGKTATVADTDAVQPAWSPNGSRLAYWSNTFGQRDIMTVAAAGGTPVAVTSDAATDWAPEWSPDGRWLYFVSDRGGSPNLWRVAIDEQTGQVRGTPEPITNGVRALGSARFSRDGTRVAMTATDRAFELSLYSFDPIKLTTPVVRSTIRTATFGWCGPSPDGAWLACTARTGHEDLVLLRADGGESRRLTDDAIKDRIATWSPDGKTLAFMSMRSGGWELWAIEADGSALRQLTNFRQRLSWGAWSPDRARLATAVLMKTGVTVAFLDSTRITPFDGAAGQELGDSVSVDDWSTDGTLLAGSSATEGGDPTAVVVWDAKTRTVRNSYPMRLVRSSSMDVSFVPGTHQILVNRFDGLALVDADTGRVRPLLPAAPPFSHRISRDGRTILVERPGVESDLWLMEMAK